MFNFKDQLVVGTRGEEILLQYYHLPLVIYVPNKADFMEVHTGRLVELKSDSYNMNKTPNFFWERYSDVERKTPGGPWRARKDRVHTYVYYFVRHNKYYVFEDVKALTDFLDKYIKQQELRPFNVKNTRWITQGYAIPREAVMHLCKEYEFTVNQELQEAI